ncbi:MAG: DUF721 domain-containing protein [Bacteroidales bacterium]|jgi:predicted nucleic acid-binding Zn ribbon protein|nr:DUF721 domain-containing protein [Bacteroidales bacterium]
MNRLVDEYRLAPKLDEASVIAAWKEIAGPFAKATERIYLNRGVLYIHLNSSVIRNELMMRRSEIIRLLNEKLGRDIVDRIHFQ